MRHEKEEVGRTGREMGDSGLGEYYEWANKLRPPPAPRGQKNLIIKNARALWQAELFHSRQVAVATRILSAKDELAVLCNDVTRYE